MTQDNDVFCQVQYERAFDEIHMLRSKLPESSFVSLAREVLTRVANHSVLNADVSFDASPAEIETLATALISANNDAGAKIIRTLRIDGASLEVVYLSYIACASQLLGEWWEEDRISLLDVTVGTGRIYAILRSMSELIAPVPILNQKTAVFSAVPGETHTLGVRMAADLFRNNGWEIDLKIGLEHQQLVDDLASSGHVLMGLSGGGEHCVAEMAKLVLALRISSPNARILISGNIVNEARDVVTLMGVDAMATTFDEAEIEMERLWREIEDDGR